MLFVLLGSLGRTWGLGRLFEVFRAGESFLELIHIKAGGKPYSLSCTKRLRPLYHKTPTLPSAKKRTSYLKVESSLRTVVRTSGRTPEGSLRFKVQGLGFLSRAWAFLALPRHHPKSGPVNSYLIFSCKDGLHLRPWQSEIFMDPCHKAS